jgi:hypothetical protein
MKTRIIVLIAMLLVSAQGRAWIAYGFQSGMSRFEVHGYLAEKESLVVTEDLQQTLAGPEENDTRYRFIYCSTPQKLYLMKFRLGGSFAEFVKEKEKYERRYGKPEGPDQVSDEREKENWEAVNISLIWIINESETILLSHGHNGTIAEFQDVSICK